MATGLLSVARSIAGALGVALSTVLWEHQRTTHAIEMARQAGLERPSQMMLAEATITAYQDIFMLSGFLSLCTLLPGLLRKRPEHMRKPGGEDGLCT